MVSILKEPRKCFAFVQFETMEDVDRIYKETDFIIKNRPVKVKEAKLSFKQLRQFKPVARIESKINERLTENTGFAEKREKLL